MSYDATRFISARSNQMAFTQRRIKEVLWYITECYIFLKRDKPKYSKAWCSNNTCYLFEDYLKMEFVDNYLIKNKSIIQEKFSMLEEISFQYETIKRYTDKKGVERSDKIDIYINKLGIQDIWKEHDEHLYLAIECKRIGQISDCKKYIGDIQKFCDRNYSQTRLPFEGMMAFLESNKITPVVVSENINKRLKQDQKIKTSEFLKTVLINHSFDGGYLSMHEKVKDTTFSIYHLFFDYSDNIIV